MAYIGLDAKKLLQQQQVSNSQVLSGQPQLTPEQQAQQNQQTQQPQNTTGLVQDTGAAPAQQQQQIGKPAPSSGSFTNLQQYVQKNQPGTQKLGQAVVGNLQSAADRARKDIAQTQQKFGTELEASSLQGRDTAVQEALKVAQQAAGGVQTQQTQEDLKAKYQQPIQQLQSQIEKDNQKLAATQAAQKQYQQYSSNVPIYNQIQNYLNEVNKTGTSLHGTGKVFNYFSNPAQARAMAELIMNTQDPITGAGGNVDAMRNRIRDAFNSQDFINKAVSTLGGDASYYNDWRAGADTKVDPNSDMVGVYGLSAAPKYADRSKDIASIQKQLDLAKQDVDLYKGLSEIAPTPQQIPDILKTASQFGGDVSEQRFRDIINAAYQGPRNLYDIQGYENALANTREAERRLGLVNERGIDANLLDTTFKGKGRDYTSGLRGLDQLLLGTPDQLQNLQGAKKNIGSVQGTMSQAEQLSRATGKERADLIDQIRKQARGQVQGVSEARAGQVESRLGSVIQNWEKLPQYFRDAITKQGPGAVKLSDAEAAMLGVSSGEGLYNLIKDAGIENVIKTKAADKEKLISKSEQSQLAKLQNLAQMANDYGVQGSDLSFRNQYQDAAKAGTQTAFDAMDAESLRRALNEAETGFRESAARTNAVGTGIGHDRYKSGFKSRDVFIRKDLSANLKDALQRSGYDFNRPLNEQTSNAELMKAVGAVTRGDTLNTSDPMGLEEAAIQSATLGPAYGASNFLLDNMGLGNLSPQALGAMGINLAQKGLDVANKIPGAKLAMPGLVGANAIAGIAGNFFGSGKGRATSTATINAERQAAQNLQANLNKILSNMGYENRFAVDSNDPAVRARRLQLAQTLAGLDATNTKNADNQVVENPFDQDILQFAKRINQGYRRS